MQTVSNIYTELLKKRGTQKEFKAVVAEDEYAQDRIWSLNTRSSMFEGNRSGVGFAVSRELDIELRSPGTIPRAAQINIYIRLINGTEVSEWIQKGVFFIVTRDYDKESDRLVIQGNDAMRKTEPPFTTPGDQGNWPRKDIDVVNEICQRIGVSLDSRTKSVLTKGYLVQYPGIVSEDGTPKYDEDGAYSMREILGYIGSMYAGNWIISDTGELLLVVLGDIPEETNLLIEEHGDYITLGGTRLLVG